MTQPKQQGGFFLTFLRRTGYDNIGEAQRQVHGSHLKTKHGRPETGAIPVGIFSPLENTQP